MTKIHTVASQTLISSHFSLSSCVESYCYSIFFWGGARDQVGPPPLDPRLDVILFAPDFGPLLSRLGTLFNHLSQGGIKLNLSKCAIGKKEVKFLGHIVSEAGCPPDPENVKAVQNMKPPTNTKGVRSFLGMCGFYRKHIPSFAKIAAPLTNLTLKNVEFK